MVYLVYPPAKQLLPDYNYKKVLPASHTADVVLTLSNSHRADAAHLTNQTTVYQAEVHIHLVTRF